MKQTGIQIQRGEGEGFAEVFFPGDGDTQQPTIQLRPKTTTENTKAVIAGEALHFFGGLKQDGTPFHPQFFDLKQKFIKGLTQEELEFSKRVFEKHVAAGKTGSNFESFESFMQNVYADLLIRGLIYPELMTDDGERKEFQERKFITPEQSKLIDQMEQLVR